MRNSDSRLGLRGVMSLVQEDFVASGCDESRAPSSTVSRYYCLHRIATVLDKLRSGL